MANRWTLTNEVKQKYIPLIEDFIDEWESNDAIEEMDLSGTDLSPMTLIDLLKSMGYEEGYFDTNGWQWDFWVTMTKEGYKPLWINGTGITFSLRLSGKEE